MKSLKKYMAAMLITTLGISMLMSGCANTDNITALESSQTAENEATENKENEAKETEIKKQYTDEDIASSWDESSASKIILSDEGITAQGEGIITDDTTVTITQAGTYILSGSLSNGQIRIEASNEDRVILVLNTVEISNADSAVIYGLQADKTTIILAEGSENIISDGSTYVYGENDNEEDEEPNAAIFSKDDLFLTGKGSLKINANYNNAVQSKDDLVIADGNYEITCVHNAFHGKDSLTILDGSFNIDAGHNAFHTKGNLVTDGGTFTIKAAKKGFHADEQLVINGGNIDITASYEGMEGFKIIFNGGNTNIVASDDGINATKTTDDATENTDANTNKNADENTNENTINTDDADKKPMGEKPSGEMPSGEMPRGERPSGEMPSGEIPKGERPSGEMPSGAMPQRGGMDEVIEGCEIVINDGIITINASGDGMDSNGNIYQNGGEVYINGPEGNGDGALDYNGVYDICAGTLSAAGSTGMAQSVSASSTQPAIMLKALIQPQSEITILDKSKNQIFSHTAVKKAECIVISDSSLKLNEEYTILLDGNEISTVTLEDILTDVNTNSNIDSKANIDSNTNTDSNINTDSNANTKTL